MLKSYICMLAAVIALDETDSAVAQLAKGPRSGSIPGGVVVTTEKFTFVSVVKEPVLNTDRIEDDDRKYPSPPPPFNVVPPARPEGSLYVDGDHGGMSSLILPPVLVESFPGIPDIGENHDPPDAIMAAGPNHILACVNNRFRIWDKNGNVLKTISAPPWFASALPAPSGQWYIFDPKVRYDHFANRWIMLWLADNRPTRNTGYLLISVSDDDNPLGTWYNWALPSNTVGDSLVTNCSDFPGFGFDSSAFYITSDQTSPSYAYVYDKIRILQKGQFYANTAGPIAWRDFWDLREPNNLAVNVFTTKPAIVFGSPGTAFLLGKSPYTTQSVPGTFFTLWKITDPLANPTISAVNISVGSYFRTADVLGQLGGGTVTTPSWSDFLSDPVYRDSSLWAVHDIASGSGNQFSSLRYVRINPFADSLLEDVTYGREGYWYIMPALMVDQSKNLLITYSRSSLNEYIGAYLSGRRDNDAPGLSSEVVLKLGESNFQRVPAMRWGDYMSSALDPSDRNAIWMFAQYAASPANTWGTWVGQAKLTTTSVGVSEDKRMPGEYRLEQNFPNPFNSSTVIGYRLPATADMKLLVYDLLGREVSTLVNERMAGGAYSVKFDASSLSSGVYFYRLQVGEFVQTRRLLMIK